MVARQILNRFLVAQAALRGLPLYAVGAMGIVCAVDSSTAAIQEELEEFGAEVGVKLCAVDFCDRPQRPVGDAPSEWLAARRQAEWLLTDQLGTVVEIY